MHCRFVRSSGSSEKIGWIRLTIVERLTYQESISPSPL
jgi:hypothetical protein